MPNNQNDFHQTNPIAAMLEEASRALGFEDIDRGPGNEPLRIHKPAASMRCLVLKTTKVSVDRSGLIRVGAEKNLAGETITLDQAIAKASRAAQAGANVITYDVQAPVVIETGSASRVMGLFSSPKQFVSVDPAVFSEIADDEDCPETPRPVHACTVSKEGRQFGVRFRVNHAEKKLRGQEQVANEILQSIISGVSATVDSVLLGAIVSATPGAFTLAAAAASGMRVSDLRGFVGRSGTGASFRADGQLVAGGIPAEFSPAIEKTIVGAFERCAVTIGPEMTIQADRLNLNGDLVVQAWLNIGAAVPDSSKFWEVA